MSNQYSCELIRDLLPGYIDTILSKTSTDIVTNHLTACSQCRLIYQEMTADLKDANCISCKECAAVDGLKKIRKRTLYLKTSIAFVSGLLGILLLYLFLSAYVIGAVQPPNQITMTDLHYDEETQALTITGVLNRPSMHISRVVWTENASFANRIDVSVYAARLLPFWPEKQEFSVTIPQTQGQSVYLVGTDYEQSEIYSWKKDHAHIIRTMEEEIYNCFPSDWQRDNILLSCLDGIKTVDGTKGVLFHVDFLAGGDEAYYQQTGDTVLVYGDLEPADFAVWVSLDEPHKIFIHNPITGEYTTDYTILEQFHK